MEFGVWPETAIRLIPPHTFLNESEAALVALAGRHVNGRVSPCSSSASITDSNADKWNPWRYVRPCIPMPLDNRFLQEKF
jgi:hypothetical protein